ncbi:MAG: Biotin transporter BioY [Chlamydiae bacterium]|nr:Biotin transporter BioY [Chlamydiota bacterium]
MHTWALQLRPQQKGWAIGFELLLVTLGSLFLAGMAQIAFYLWFTPVPVTMQTFAVLLLGACLGSKRGAFAVLLYLAEGALGLPFFAGGGFGLAYLLGVKAGYLLGFLPAAYLVGLLFERGAAKSYLNTFLAMTLGSTIILGCGALWLSQFVGFSGALSLGVFPFLLGDLLKVGAATAALPTISRFLQK